MKEINFIRSALNISAYFCSVVSPYIETWRKGGCIPSRTQFAQLYFLKRIIGNLYCAGIIGNKALESVSNVKFSYGLLLRSSIADSLLGLYISYHENAIDELDSLELDYIKAISIIKTKLNNGFCQSHNLYGYGSIDIYEEDLKQKKIIYEGLKNRKTVNGKNFIKGFKEGDIQTISHAEIRGPKKRK